MELTIALALSIIGTIISVSNFVLTRKDKAVKDKSEQDGEKTEQKTEQVLIDYRLKKVEEKLDKVLDKLDGYDKEISEQIDKALENHIKLYHKEK